LGCTAQDLLLLVLRTLLRNVQTIVPANVLRVAVERDATEQEALSSITHVFLPIAPMNNGQDALRLHHVLVLLA
jgi:hypothetical protein